MDLYVFDNLEVKLTGRTAFKEPKSQAGRRRFRPNEQTEILHEITPADQELGSWKKWVPLAELYKIKASTDE